MGKTIRRSKKNTRSRKTRTFKKHYMWNTKGKKYLAKTYKQHLKGKKLGCWCKPECCHGDVLVELLMNRDDI